MFTVTHHGIPSAWPAAQASHSYSRCLSHDTSSCPLGTDSCAAGTWDAWPRVARMLSLCWKVGVEVFYSQEQCITQWNVLALEPGRLGLQLRLLWLLAVWPQADHLPTLSCTASCPSEAT